MHETAIAALKKFKDIAEYNLKIARKELMWAERSVEANTETIAKEQADIAAFGWAIAHLDVADEK